VTKTLRNLRRMWREQLRREHHSEWTWAHGALEQVLRELEWPEVEWRQVSEFAWEATSGEYRLSVYGQAGRWNWRVTVLGPTAQGIAASAADAFSAAEAAL
jgi:hypothetical protein